MTALAANLGRVYEANIDPVYTDLPLAAGAVVFEGSFLGENGATGNARALVAGDNFMGIAAAGATGGAGAGDVVVRARQRGIVKLSVATLASSAGYGATVHAIDDGDASLAGTSPVGKVARHISGTNAMVAFEAEALRSI